MASTGRHVEDRNAKPFLLVGDTAWSLFVALSDSDADVYLENRKQHGFTAVLANLIEHKYAANAPANFYGFTPFTGQTFTTPREAYFAHVDYIVKSAAEKGIAVFLFPLYLGYQCNSEGWCAEVENATDLGDDGMGPVCRQPVHELRQYRLGDRWGYGPEPRNSPKCRLWSMAFFRETLAIRSPYTTRRGVMAVTPWSGAEWLNVNNIYTNGTDYQQAVTAYSLSPPKPFFLIESQYENVTAPNVQMLRAQSYWTVLSGGFGRFFWELPSLGVRLYRRLLPSSHELASTT